MALRGLFQEAVAKNDTELKKVLEEYDVILGKDPSNMVSAHCVVISEIAKCLHSLFRRDE